MRVDEQAFCPSLTYLTKIESINLRGQTAAELPENTSLVNASTWKSCISISIISYYIGLFFRLNKNIEHKG